MVAPTTQGPLSAGRIEELDALRGLAVIGIAWMNVYVYSMPFQAYANPVAWGGEDSATLAVWAGSFVLIEDKFRTLFAMLFGAGVAILLDGKRDHAWRNHYARMAVLFVFGLVHAVLLANNDILRAYALAGLALPFFARSSQGLLYGCAAALLAMHIAGSLLWMREGLQEWLVGTQGQDWRFWETNYGSDPDGIAISFARGEEAFGERVARRFASIPATTANIAASVPLNLGTMLVGIALWRNGLLAAQWKQDRLLHLASRCAMIALPALIALAFWTWDAGFPGVIVAFNALVLSAPFDVLLGVSYAALAMAGFASARTTMRRILARVGRMSLTNYVATSVIFAALFSAWGLGWFGEVSRSSALVLSLLPGAAMLIWSPLWLLRFRQGPLEWLWRAIATMRFGPLLRRQDRDERHG